MGRCNVRLGEYPFDRNSMEFVHIYTCVCVCVCGFIWMHKIFEGNIVLYVWIIIIIINWWYSKWKRNSIKKLVSQWDTYTTATKMFKWYEAYMYIYKYIIILEFIFYDYSDFSYFFFLSFCSPLTVLYHIWSFLHEICLRKWLRKNKQIR